MLRHKTVLNKSQDVVLIKKDEESSQESGTWLKIPNSQTGDKIRASRGGEETHRGGCGLWLTHLKSDLKILKVWGGNPSLFQVLTNC